MKNFLVAVLMLSAISASAQNDSVSIKSVLLQQLKSTHKVQDWFVPASNAITGLTADQANWKDSSENHSIAQLTTHLIFWNKQLLDQFSGIKPPPFSGDNKETFAPVTPEDWKATTLTLDSVLSAWEAAIERSEEQKLQKWYSTIANMSIHNAYHTGQIMYIRKMKGWWDDSKGVK